MRTERDSLKETIEELHCVQAQEGQLTSGKMNNCYLIWVAKCSLLGQAWIVWLDPVLTIITFCFRFVPVGEQWWLWFASCWDHHPRDSVWLEPHVLFNFGDLKKKKERSDIQLMIECKSSNLLIFGRLVGEIKVCFTEEKNIASKYHICIFLLINTLYCDTKEMYFWRPGLEIENLIWEVLYNDRGRQLDPLSVVLSFIL